MPDKLALHGGPKSVQSNFPWPIFDEAEVEAVAQIVRSGQWGNPDCMGAVEQFEREFANYCGAKYAVSCVNGSVSLRLALIASGIMPGDEVIVPPYTFIATASTVIESNAVPIFVDIDSETYNLDQKKIEAAISPRTKAIIPVHFAGQACDMDAIMDIAQRHDLRVIEDAAHGHGAEYKGKKLGTIGDAGSFSFQSSKNLTSGEGGIVVTNDAELYRKMASLRNVGRLPEGEWYDHFLPGCNYRLTPMQAVLLSSQLKRLDEQTIRRNENGVLLNKLLAEIEGIEPLRRGHGETMHCHHLYIFKYDSTHFNHLPKAHFLEMLAAEGVPCFKGYPYPLYRQPLFQEKNFMCYALPELADYSRVVCPVAERACGEEAVWILQHAMLGSEEDMLAFVAAIRKIQRAALAKK
ncbi:DegT/DnrJ/EryC1/StrS family aminotransferase [Persicitalea sp.]|uniref:DegT/DnrJ/EryC1/StrS family aminotransferase n=1 Tax=Persicitalea sp. TaxID=3100273 RepID=UPI0035947266